MTATFEVDLSSLQSAARRLDGFSKFDRGRILHGIGGALEQTTKDRFEDQAAPDGTDWEPSLRARLVNGQTLIKSGGLRDSIGYDVSGDTVEVGTNKIYAGVHQFGAIIKAKDGGSLRFPMPGGGWVFVKQVTIPARPFLGFGQAEEDAIDDVLADWAEGVIK